MNKLSASAASLTFDQVFSGVRIFSLLKICELMAVICPFKDVPSARVMSPFTFTLSNSLSCGRKPLTKSDTILFNLFCDTDSSTAMFSYGL